MAKVTTRSTRIFKDDDSNNNSKSKQISGSTASETSGLRRSTRDKSSKNVVVSVPSSSTRKSERTEKLTLQTSPTKRRSERIESPVHVSEGSEKHHSLNSSGSKKFVNKCFSSSVTKKEKEKMEKGEKQLKLNSGVHTRNEKKKKNDDLEPVPVILKKKRFDARSYRAFIFKKYIKPRESKAKELDQTLKGHGHHENTGDGGSKKVEDLVKCMKHKNRQEEDCKSKNGDSSAVSKNGDSSPVSNNGDSYFPLSSPAAKSKEAIVDADKMQVDCSTREDLQKSESMGSPSEGKSLPGDHDFERAVEVGALKRKKLDMDFNASVMEDSEKIGASTAHAVCSSPSGSKESILSSICVSCSKRQRVDFDSQIVVCSCHSQRIHDLCNTSLPEEVCEEASCARSPQNSEMAVSCIQKDGTTRDVDLIDVQKEDDADLDGGKLFPNDGSKAGHDQIGLPGRIVIPITVEEDGTELEATACSMGITGECSNRAQLKDSPLDIQPGSNQDTCVVCKLGGKILCCDGNGCKKSYHLSCLNPPLKAVPRGSWYCLLCVKKRIESGEHSVSGGVESIWDVREAKLSDGEGMHKQYFVKYRSLAHVHNRWVPESQLLLDAPMLVSKFEKKQVVSWKKEWTVPQRLLQKRLLMTPEQRDQYLSENQYYKSTKERKKHHERVSTLISNLHYEWFVKWRGLGYEHATWELENAQCLRQQVWTKKDYESRRKRAKSASDPSRADKVLQEKSGPCFKLSKLPGIFKPGMGNDHLCFVNKLRECWHKSQNTVVMDDKERVMKVILFILSLHSNVCRPFLIISTSSALSAWEAEFMCLAPSVNVVVYSGHRDVRETIRMLEFYEEGGSTMFQVLLSHADAIVEDLEVLNCLEWEAIVVDECQQSSVSKHFEQIKMLTTELKVLLTSGPIEDSMVEYLNLLSFIDSEVGWNNNDNLKIDANVNIDKLKERFGRFVASGLTSDSSDFVEYWVPVRLSSVQLEQYCATLLSNSMSLRSCSKNDPIGALRDILISTRKCCDHPYIVDPSLQGLITKGLPGAAEYLDVGVNASGKLQLLDKILSEIVKRELRALILFQSIGGSGRNHIGDILEDFLCQRFGPDSYERVESGLLASKKQFALSRFNNKESGRFVFLVENRACHPSIKLSSVDIAILFNSDWNPINDLRALQRITIDSEFEQLKVFRLYSSSTLEEKALILAKQDMALDNNVQNISCSTCHMLLKWGASCLFKKLDEFHGCNLSHGSIISSEQSLLNDVMKELLEQLPNDAGRSNTSNCSIILKVKQTGLTYSSHISLLGELEMQSSDEEPPHVFWPRLLEGRCPRWRYLTEPSPRVRKKVQYFDELQKRSEVDDDDTVKRRKKVVNNTSDPTSLNTWVEDKRKTVNVNNEGASEIPASKGSQLLPRPTVNTDAVCHPNINSELPEAHTVEPEEKGQLSDSQKNLHRFLKPEISKLCEILQLPEDVKGVSGKFLEYVMNNHCVSREPATIFQAFQISLCWTAASLLKQKMNHKETLALARQHLNFECKDEEADSVYSKLRELKKMFSRRAESAMGSSSAECPSRTRDAAEHLVHGRASQAAADDQQELEEGEIRESSQRQNCSGKKNSPEEQAIDSKKVNGSEENDYSKSILQVKKIHSKRMKKLLKKQMNDYMEFNEKKLKIMENSKARLEKEHKMESTLVRAMHSSQISVRSDKLIIIDEDLARKIKELNSRLEIEQKRLEDMHLAAINEEKWRKSYWLKQAKAGRPVDSFSTLPLSYSGFRWEDMESTEQVGVSDAPEKNTSISEPSSEEHGTDGAGTVEPGQTVVAEAPKIVQNEAVDAVIPTELPGFAVHSSEENNSIDTVISEREIVDGLGQHNGRPGASDDGGSPLLENTLTSSPLAQVLPAEDSQDSQLFGSARLQGEDMSSRELQNSSPQVVVSSIQSAEALSSDQSIHDTLVLPPVVRSHLHRPTDPASSEHNQSGSLACTVIEHIANTEMLTAFEQLQLSSQPPVQDQSELFNISVPQPETQLESDHQLRHTFSQQAQVSTQPPAEDQAEIFSHSVPQSETELESDHQLMHTFSQQARVSTQPPAEDQAEIFSHSVPQSETELESDHQLMHTSSQQAQIPTQPAAEDQVEISNYSVLQPETQLESDHQLRHTSSQQAQVPTQPPAEDQAEIFSHSALQCETQLECSNQLSYNPSQQAEVPTQPPDFDVSTHPPVIDQAELFDHSNPQPETQLERGHLSSNTSSQQVQLQIQPPDDIYVERHSVPQCNTQSQLHASMERPSCGSGLRISETRSLGVVPESSNRPLLTAPVTPLISQPDTLQYELARIRKEDDQVIKFHEDLKARIDSDCEKEIEEARRKYNSLLQDAETAAVQKRETLEANFNKVYMNMILAEVIRFKCSEPKAAGVPRLQQGAYPGFLQQLLQVSSQQNVQRPFSAAGPPAAPPIQVVHHSSALFSGNPVRPHYNSVVPPTGNYQVGGQVPQFPAPHLQHCRPSTSISAPNQHSLSRAIHSQQSLGISSAASSALQHPTIYPPNYSSGSPLSTTYQSATAIQVPVPRHSSSMHELPRNIDNGPGRNPQNLFTQPNHGLTSVNHGNLQDPTARVMNTSSGDVVCLSDDE